MRLLLTAALILAAIFAVPLCCCWGKVMAEEGNPSAAVASCAHCPTAPEQDSKAPADQNQACKCIEKKIASEDGSLTTPRSTEHDCIVPPFVDASISNLLGHTDTAVLPMASATVHPPGVPVRVAYCVYRL